MRFRPFLIVVPRLAAPSGVDERQRLATGDDALQSGVDVRIEESTHMSLEKLDRLFGCHRVSIGALRRQRVKGVRGGQDTTADGDLRTAERARIAVAVPMLVMILDVVQGLTEMSERSQDIHANGDG